MQRLAVLFISFGFLTPLFADDVRTWTDIKGKYKVQAKLAEIGNDSVTLHREGGESVTVPVARLCEVDQRYIERQRKLDELTQTMEQKVQAFRTKRSRLTKTHKSLTEKIERIRNPKVKTSRRSARTVKALKKCEEERGAIQTTITKSKTQLDKTLVKLKLRRRKIIFENPFSGDPKFIPHEDLLLTEAEFAQAKTALARRQQLEEDFRIAEAQARARNRDRRGQAVEPGGQLSGFPTRPKSRAQQMYDDLNSQGGSAGVPGGSRFNPTITPRNR